MWDIGWMLLETSTGGNLIRTTSSTSAGFECKLNFVYIFCNLFTFHFFFTPVPNGARHFLAYRLDSTLHFRMADKRLLCNTFACLIRLMYGGGMRSTERRHLVEIHQFSPYCVQAIQQFWHNTTLEDTNFSRSVQSGMPPDPRQFIELPLSSPNRLQIGRLANMRSICYSRSGHCVKVLETVSHCNIPVYQIWSVCMDRFRTGCGNLGLQI